MSQSGWGPYIQVDDPKAYLDRIQQAAGTTIVPVTVIPDTLTLCALR
jgi:hypothetical protein